MKINLPTVVFGFAALWAAVAGWAFAQQPGTVLLDSSLTRQCPPDRPHRLEIETGTMTCTSAMCMGRLDCGTGTCKVVRDLGDSCNTCMMRTYVACLSEQDLKAIRR